MGVEAEGRVWCSAEEAWRRANTCSMEGLAQRHSKMGV
jgi:hypothetical protein